MELEEDLQILDAKVKQLKLEYEQYFMGQRPREPTVLRADVQKQIARYSNEPIKNTALRFKFSSLFSRFMVFKRQWDNNLRKIEAGTYERHIFKADLHETARATSVTKTVREPRAQSGSKLFESYMDAAKSCGQNVASLTPQKLQAVISKQETAIRKKYGCERVNFRVVVKDGRVKLKASPVKG